MKGDNMQDRVSLYPGRVKLEPVAGQANLYDLTRADQPTQEGTPFNKESLLKDTTAALFGLDEAAVPDDVLSIIKTLLDTAQSTANGRARVSTGTYQGTGIVHSSGSPKRLTFDFTPKFFILHTGENLYQAHSYGSGISIANYLLVPYKNGQEISMKVVFSGDPYYNKHVNVTLANNAASWYAISDSTYYPADAGTNFNSSGKTYYYISIG